MSQRRQLIRGGVALTGSQVVGNGLNFVRNILLARLLGPEDFGVAALFAMTIAVYEMISDAGAGKLIVQSRLGHRASFQASLQMFSVVRGVVGCAILYAAGGAVARLFGVPDAAWAFRAVAVVPLLKGLSHFDPPRAVRRLEYLPSIKVQLAGQFVATVVACVLAVWLRSYEAMLWSVIAQAATAMLTSHAIATRRYRWHWSPRHARTAFFFGWPLMLNGGLLFLTFHGDRMIIGVGYSMADVGLYSAALALAMAPTAMMSKLSSQLVFPFLATKQHDPVAFGRNYDRGAALVVLMATAAATGFLLLGDPLVRLLYGPQYAVSAGLIGWLGVAQVVRFVRTLPTAAAMSMGDTVNTLIANVVRGAATLGSILIVLIQGPLWWIAAAMLAGEVLALAAAVILLWLRRGVVARIGWKDRVVAGGTVAFATAAAAVGIHGLHWLASPSLAVLLLLPALALAYRKLPPGPRYPRFPGGRLIGPTVTGEGVRP